MVKHVLGSVLTGIAELRKRISERPFVGKRCESSAGVCIKCLMWLEKQQVARQCQEILTPMKTAMGRTRLVRRPAPPRMHWLQSH